MRAGVIGGSGCSGELLGRTPGGSGGSGGGGDALSFSYI